MKFAHFFSVNVKIKKYKVNWNRVKLSEYLSQVENTHYKVNWKTGQVNWENIQSQKKNPVRVLIISLIKLTDTYGVIGIF